MKNKDLKQIYDKGELDFHSGFEESMMLVGMMDSWKGLNVLEIGCGEGHLCSILSYAGANIHGIDYSLEQVRRANKIYPELSIWQDNIKEIYTDLMPYDVVVMQGVLEHFDAPWDELNWIMDNLLTLAGSCVLSVPNWVNPRGYIYHTLRLLLDARMSLTDIHFFLPDDFEQWKTAQGEMIYDSLKCQIQMTSCDFSWSYGTEMIDDLKERIPKALTFEHPGAIEIETYVEENLAPFLHYIKRMADHTPPGPLSGANLGVKIRKIAP
jgi:2-polyprenyl-3-methyl-5-hydroxy-6-metoxy-1,4-benzoquinol methylase